jgi:hypothetical protein
LFEYNVVMPNDVALATVLKAITTTTLKYKPIVDILKLCNYDAIKLFMRHHISPRKQQSKNMDSSSIDGDLCRLGSEGKLKEAVGILEQQDIQKITSSICMPNVARSRTRAKCLKKCLNEIYSRGIL